MKAIKIYNISWNLEGVNNKEEAMNNLPTVKCFTAKDDFDVIEQVPGLFQKKFGFGINSYSFSVLRVVKTLGELINLFHPAGTKEKKVFLKSGELSDYGQGCVRELYSTINRRKDLEKKNTPIEKIPSICDEVMIAVEAITGMQWDACTADEIIKELAAHIEVAGEEISVQGAIARMKLNAAKKEATKEARKAAKEEEEEEEEYDEDDDNDDNDDYED